MLRSLGTLWLGLFVFGLFAISKYDGQVYSEHETVQTEPDEPILSKPSDRFEEYFERSLPLVEIIKTHKFMLLYLLATCHLFYGYYMINSYK